MQNTERREAFLGFCIIVGFGVVVGTVIWLVLWGCVSLVEYLYPGTAVPPLVLLWGITVSLGILAMPSSLNKLNKGVGTPLPAPLLFLGYTLQCLVVGLVFTTLVHIISQGYAASFTRLWLFVSALWFFTGIGAMIGLSLYKRHKKYRESRW